MPKKDDAPEIAVCDGCGMERDDVDQVGAVMLCVDCEKRRIDDPQIVVQGRALTVSELEMQAEDDEHLAAALKGDSIQDQIKAAKADR
jgi:hypothetical protein